MSEKKAKEQRRMAKQASDKVKFTMHVDVMENGQVGLRNFPLNYHQTENIFAAAHHIMVDYFMSKALEGDMDVMGNVGTAKLIRPTVKMVNELTGKSGS